MVGRGLKAGDAFVTKVTSETFILLDTSEKIQMKEGMNVHVELSVEQAVAAAPHGDGTVSTVKVFVDRADATYADMRTAIWASLGVRAYPYSVTFDRNAAGRRARSSVIESAPMGNQRATLDGVLSGLSDLSANGLPDRDVRLGEAWDLSDAMSVTAIEDVVRYVAQRTIRREGFPKGSYKGMVKAEALETRGTEPCLRLHLVVSVSMEGDVTPGLAIEPNLVGFLTAAAKIDGTAWVSVETGLLWEEDIQSEIVSSYLTPTRPTNRHATCHVTAKTARAAK